MLRKITLKIILFFTLFSNIFINSADNINISYEVSFKNNKKHEASISLFIDGLNNENINLIISTYSPGRYAAHQFSINIYNLKVFDEKNREINVAQLRTTEYQLKSVSGSIRINYTFFGDVLDGTYSSITEDYILLNMPSAFIWIKEYKDVPITLKINKPDKNWNIETQLFKISENIYKAPDLSYFMDSPLLMGNLFVKEWEIKENNRSVKIKFALNHEADPKKIDEVKEIIDKGIKEEITIFGELPSFDNNEYLFLANYLHYAFPDGMEHRNSSVLTRNSSIDDYSSRLITTIIHEFFHTWNGKRLIPKSLANFDFSKENLSEELWFLEGFTQYFSDLVAKRINLIKERELYDRIGKTLTLNINTESVYYFSPVEISRRAFIFDGAYHLYERTNQKTNLTHYDSGYAIALFLDLTLRNKFNITLDNYMKLLWDKFGRKQIPYTNKDLENTLTLLTADKNFSESFFNKYIYNNNKIDFNVILKEFGLILKIKNPNEGYLGANYILFDNDKIELLENPKTDSPLDKAGLKKGDKIISINNIVFKNYYDFTKFLEKNEPQTPVLIIYRSRSETLKKKIVLESLNEYTIKSFEDEKVNISESAKNRRLNWIGK